MPDINVPIYRNEAGSQFYPISYGTYDTHCGNGVKKDFREVLITWNGSLWLQVLEWEAGAIPALLVENPCNDTFALLAISYDDFRLKQLCCEGPNAPTVGIYVSPYTPQYV